MIFGSSESTIYIGGIDYNYYSLVASIDNTGNLLNTWTDANPAYTSTSYYEVT